MSPGRLALERRGAGAACALVCAMAVVLASGCRGGKTPEAPPALLPASSVGQDVASNAPDAGASAASVAIASGMPRLDIVLEDARLAAARERTLALDAAGAAKAIDEARTTASLDPARACTWAYASARAHAEASQYAEAAGAFEAVRAAVGDAGTPCCLAPYADFTRRER